MTTFASSADETPWPRAIDWVAPAIKPPSEWRLKDLDACHADERRRRVRTTVWMEVESEKERAAEMVDAFHRGDWDVVFGDSSDEIIDIPNDVLGAMDAIAPQRAPHRSSTLRVDRRRLETTFLVAVVCVLAVVTTACRSSSSDVEPSYRRDDVFPYVRIVAPSCMGIDDRGSVNVDGQSPSTEVER